ncbi:hypothetical protein EDD37DRAFT_190186 [Exophiala viscosa]|uniref:uncharacterized protein n=1 Tax=Exophiala viscosa TaxID=2486360 RepID=UPI00219F08E7|nr:hypothetical protein EDD37DRAFT_190186 [Exophiala viscosa]
MDDQETQSTFLRLPIEIRQHIYDFAISAQHLKAPDQRFVDPQWHDKPQGLPGLLLVNKAISQEAISIFYSRAILNIAPLHPPEYLFDALNARGPKLNLTLGLQRMVAPFPAQNLARVETCHIYAGQSKAINAEAYEALLGWLMTRTSVQSIKLSSRLMTRLRRARTALASTHNLYLAASGVSVVKTVYIYSQHARSPWELTQMSRLRSALAGRELPVVQAHVWNKNRGEEPFLDPRWDVRHNDDDQPLAKMDQLSTWYDSLLAADSICQARVGRQPEQTDKKLYQVCFVFEVPP